MNSAILGDKIETKVMSIVYSHIFHFKKASLLMNLNVPPASIALSASSGQRMVPLFTRNRETIMANCEYHYVYSKYREHTKQTSSISKSYHPTMTSPSYFCLKSAK